MLTEKLRSMLLVPEIEAAVNAVADRVGEYDSWGYSPEASKLYFSLAYRIFQYFRPEVHGIENMPTGRVLVIPNHSGQFPFDAITVAVACLVKAHPPRLVRAMAERWFPTLPFVNIAFSRCGVTVGDPVNARNLLEAENALLVFPEGARGSGKTWDHRYQLAHFGRGFMRLSLQTGAPVVPVAVIGAEESIVSVHDAPTLASALGMPYFPIPALLPILGPLAYLPLPTRFSITFGEPMRFSGPFDDEDEVIDQKVAVVKQRVQTMVDDGVARRDSIF
ncbi:MAG: acyltransferase family protein [Deltaproteobacteria bacterium]|nr:acyltransferase family protein [Deltaproteobacteria bacterium]